MSDWSTDIDVNLTAFCEENDLSRNLFITEYHPAPHRPPQLPRDKRIVYGFWMERWDWLKIGRLGPNSQARSTTQHYLDGNARSCLPRSIRLDPEMHEAPKLDRYRLRDWIMRNTCRANILVSAREDQAILLRLEKFLHRRLKPRYEGGGRGGPILVRQLRLQDGQSREAGAGPV
jgi:hypothetical protein